MRWRAWIAAALTAALLVLTAPLGARESDRIALPAVRAPKVDLKLDTVPVAGDRLRLQLSKDRGTLRGCRAYTAGAGGWEQTRVDWTSARPDAKAVLDLAPNRMTLFKPGVAEKQTLGEDGVEVAGGLFLNEKKPGVDRGRLRRFRLHLRPAVSPLPWVESGSAFEADLFVGVREVDPEEGAAEPISWRHPITVVLSGTTARAEPNTLGITESGTDGFRKVRIRCARHDPVPYLEGDSPIGAVALEIPVDALLRKIQLTAAKTRIWGFGLEATTLGVELFAQDGLPWRTPAALDVVLSTDRGNVPSTIEVPSGEYRGEGALRSRETGSAKVRARALGRESEPLELEFTRPYSVLVWALIGALLGTVARMFVDAKRRKKDEPGPTPARQVGRVVIGLVAGFALVAATFVGIREGVIPELAAYTELGCGLIALVGGYAGATVLDRLSKKFLPDKSEES